MLLGAQRVWPHGRHHGHPESSEPDAQEVAAGGSAKPLPFVARGTITVRLRPQIEQEANFEEFGPNYCPTVDDPLAEMEEEGCDEHGEFSFLHELVADLYACRHSNLLPTVT